MAQSHQRMHNVLAIRKPNRWPSGSSPLRAGVILGSTLLFTLFQFFLQLTSGEIVDGLMQSFSLSALGGGVLASMYYYIYVVLQTPVGLLLDRFGARFLLSLGAFICAIGCGLFSISSNLAYAIIGRLLMGGGAAFAFVGTLNIASYWFPVNRFTVLAAIAETVGMLGSIVGGLFLAKFIQHTGWRHAMLYAALLAFGMSVLIWIVVRNKPNQSDNTALFDRKAFLHAVYCLLRNKKAWINGIYSGLLFSIVTSFIGLWGIPYLQVSHHFNLAMSTFVCDLTFAGIAIGGPLFGWLDSRMINRHRLLIISPLVAAVLLSIVILSPNLPTPLLEIIMIVLGLVISSYVLTFAIANEIVNPPLRSTSMGFVNTLSVGTAPIVQPFIGWLLSLSALHSYHQLKIYTIHNYQFALLSLPLILLLAAILAFFMPRRPYAVKRK